MTESDYSLMKTPQKPLLSVSKRGQYAIKCFDWSESAYLLQSMHRGLIKSAMPPPHISTRTNSQTRNRLSSLFTHLHLHTVLLHKREQLDIDHTFLPEEGIPVPSFDLEPKSILNKSFVVCCFLKGTGFWKLLSWCINLQNLQSHWFSFDMKTKTSPGNPQLHFSLFDLSVCLFLQMPFFVSVVCVYVHMISSLWWGYHSVLLTG